MKRIFLFLITNFAVLAVLGFVTNILGLGQYLTANGIDYTSLFIYSLVIGFTGSIISLLMSKTMAKTSMGLTMIDQPRNADEAWIVETVRKLSMEAGVAMPEVGIYEGAPNAFATGAFKNSALVGVSTGLLQGMTREEVEAVLAHEIAHVANGDMVTMTLIQGVVNTFVVFLSRVVGMVIDGFLRGNNRSEGDTYQPGPGYMISTLILDMVFGFLASIIVAWFSRQREYRADAGAARLMRNKQPMIHALQRLGHMQAGTLPKGMQALGITGALGQLFSTHPPLEARIASLQQATDL